jgi:D-alanine transaminase
MNPTQPIPLANLDGVILPLSEARVSALDRGFLFGDSVYEVLSVLRGRPWLEAPHFARLARSLEAIRIHGVDVERLRRRMLETLKSGGFSDAMVYIQVTRGSAPLRGHLFPADAKPLEFLYVQALSDPYAEMRRDGAAVVTRPDERWARCDIKSTNLLANVLAKQSAKEAGCYEALLYLPDGRVTEATHSSLFGVVGGRLVTAPNGPDILPGVTRQFVLELTRKLDIPVQERNLTRTELERIDELFLSGTTIEVLPITRLDGKPVGDGKPGPVTRRLQAAYQAEVVRFLAAPNPA